MNDDVWRNDPRVELGEARELLTRLAGALKRTTMVYGPRPTEDDLKKWIADHFARWPHVTS